MTKCPICNDTKVVLKDEVDHNGEHVQVELPCECTKHASKK